MRQKINVQKTMMTVIVINILQIFLIGGIVIESNIKMKEGQVIGIAKGSLVLFIIIFFIIINSIIMIKNIFFYNFSGNESVYLKATIHQMEKLNTVLRAQRHDFMNHLQIVYSLMEMKEFNEASNYLETVYKDIQKVNKILKTSNSAVNALLQAKSIYCEQKSIDMEINISTQLKNLKIPSWELCRVIGNIVDNAVYALEAIPENKKIEVSIGEDIRYFRFIVRNNGPKIPEQYRKKIFEAGFTTKRERGEGMGLAISREIMTKYGGGITVSSNNDWTEFVAFVPINS